jgi:hypothetical protein
MTRMAAMTWHRGARSTFAAIFIAVSVVVGCSDGTLEVDDVDVQVSYPEGWTEAPLGVVKSMLEEQLETATGEIRTTVEAVIEEIDRGAIRSVVFSPTTSDGFTESLFVTIEEGDADLVAAAERRIDRMRLFAETFEHDVAEVDLPIGPARRVEVFSEPQGGSPSHLIEYIVLLADGSDPDRVGHGSDDRSGVQ